jgi:hypothetical protein
MVLTNLTECFWNISSAGSRQFLGADVGGEDVGRTHEETNGGTICTGDRGAAVGPTVVGRVTCVPKSDGAALDGGTLPDEEGGDPKSGDPE